MSLAWLSAAEGARRIAAGRLASERWTEALLARAAALQPELAAWITLDTVGAISAARTADAEIRTGGARSRLHGVPFGLKDCIDVAGIRTTGHSRLLLGNFPARDATVAARLKQAGAVLLGKQAMYELSYGGPSFDLPFPPARNPWNPDRIPGGSSSGSAAALASGQCPIAIGTDAGGSIRQPAAYCGIVGLKPTLGVVPRDGVLPMTFTMGEPGPMARTVEDCAALFDVMCGADTTRMLGRSAAGVRIGVLRDFFDSAAVRAVPDVIALVDACVSHLSSLGAQMADVRGPSPHDLDACGRIILLAEAFANHEAQLRADPTTYGRLARHRFALGAFLSAADLLQAQRRRQSLAAEMESLLSQHDILVCAAEVSAAPRFDEVSGESFPFVAQPSLRIAFNLTGHPALALPCSFDGEGMPLSLQLVGRRGEEGCLLAVAHALEAKLGIRDVRPPRFA